MRFHQHLAIFSIICAILAQSQPSFAGRFLDRNFEMSDGRPDKSRPAPLVIALHGFLGTGKNMRRKTGFDALAHKHGLVVVYPNGQKRRWNDGRSARNRVDDVGYLTSLIEALISNGSAARGHIFLTGHSNGGGMAMRMACEKPDLVDAIAVVATKTPSRFQCKRGRPVPALFIHGTKDPIAPHAGRPDSSRFGAALSSRDTIALWVRRNRCSNSTQEETLDNRNDGTSVDIARYTQCAASLTHITINGHGHDWPEPGNKATRLQGPATQELSATSVVWQFFRGHLPPK